MEWAAQEPVVEYFDEGSEDESVTSSDKSSERSYRQTKRIKFNKERTDKDITKRLGQKKTSEKKQVEMETDPMVLERRQKQIDYGKNTVGYTTYLLNVPLHKRTKDQPKTPDKYRKYSRRSWDQLIKIWRKQLHTFDPEGDDGSDEQTAEIDNKISDHEDADIKQEETELKNELAVVKKELVTLLTDDQPYTDHELHETKHLLTVIKHEPGEVKNEKVGVKQEPEN